MAIDVWSWQDFYFGDKFKFRVLHSSRWNCPIQRIFQEYQDF